LKTSIADISTLEVSYVEYEPHTAKREVYSWEEEGVER